jgi:hypothetical protein
MKNILLILFLSFSFLANSQITIEKKTFPQLGDTLKYFLENNPEGLMATPAGADQLWDLGILDSQVQLQQIIFPVSESTGADTFPDADYFIVSDSPVDILGTAQSGERFMKVFNNKIDEVGFFTSTDFGFDFAQKYVGNNVFRRAPLSYQDVFDSDYSFALAISTEALPDSLTDQLPILPDSIRLRFEVERSEFVDAWGTMTLPSGSFPVLRLDRTDNIKPLLDILIAPGIWQEIDPDLLGGLGGLFGEQNLHTQLFYNDKSKEEIAIFTLNEGDTVTTVQYKANNIRTNTIIVKPGIQEIIAYPNPTFGEIKFELLNYTPGSYKLVVYNIIGKKLWQSSYQITDSNRTIKENFAFLKKGTYLYSIVDSKGKKISTKRLVIITP